MAPRDRRRTVSAVSAAEAEPSLEEIVERRRARLVTVGDALRHLPPPRVISWSASRLNPALRYAYQGVSPILFVDGHPRPVVLSVYSQPTDETLDPFTISVPYDRVVHAVWSAALQRPIVEMVADAGTEPDTVAAHLFARAFAQPRTKAVSFPAWSIDTITAHVAAWVARTSGRTDVVVEWSVRNGPTLVGTAADTYDVGSGKVSSGEFDTLLRRLLDREDER